MTTVAAIDIGTNSTKLLIADGITRRFDVDDTRLGQGVAATGRLDPEAIDRTLACLARYADRIAAAGVDRLGVVATSATRDSLDREPFLDAVESLLGVRPVVLSGAQEGRLAHRGATAGVVSPSHLGPLVLDIGGGSTELVLAADGADVVESIDVGCVRLSEAELRHDPPRPEELTNAIGRVTDELDDALLVHPELGHATTIIGVGGTITTVAAVELGRFDREALHGFVLTRAAAEDVFRTLATEALADRVHNPGLPTSRAPVIVGGLCVLVAVMRRLRADSVTVSTHGLVDGICSELAAARPWPPSESPR